MPFEMEKTNYEQNALEPYISAETMAYHYGKHYKTYIENLNKLILGTDFANMKLKDIICATAEKSDLSLL